VISTYYLSPEGQAAVAQAAADMKARLAARRADRELTAALGPRRADAQPVHVVDAALDALDASINDALAPALRNQGATL